MNSSAWTGIKRFEHSAESIQSRLFEREIGSFTYKTERCENTTSMVPGVDLFGV
jgi:hypothetical protein